MAANILCKEIVHKAFHVSAFVSATPIAIPSNTEWKHKATINIMLSPNELTVTSDNFEEYKSVFIIFPLEFSYQPNIGNGRYFRVGFDEVKSLSDLHEDGLDGLDDNLFVDSGSNGDSESNRVEEEFGNEVIKMNVGEEYENVKLLEEYESNDNDVFYSDSEDESPEARI
ncbi:hypothetical protein JRO89_XS07G0160300 [Xanthoceras sorbifolium]|uniref:Uncharacterized protein n=1 Tax=Xanthoceras sorbifolium TaxID=99658 RepID=A0ABQ8HTX7_9ROSI|nr:hypothetical protein JRO89_XS07G0160300 [Xanthoceras sorbifolium]